MIDIELYIRQLMGLLEVKFGARLLYVGLQGSYLREEATESSDIDIMVILDSLGIDDLAAYRSLIQRMDHFDKSCGFICGREDLANWNPLEICFLLNSTKDYYGTLSSFVPEYSLADVRNFVKMSLNNMYHELCHRYIHGNLENTMKALPFVYKSAFYILQSLHYLRTGEFVGTKAQLLEKLEGCEKDILARCIAYGEGETFDFAEAFRLLFSWCQKTLQSV